MGLGDDTGSRGGSTTVLLADDHPALRSGICALVDAEPGMHVVAEAGNGQDALSKIEAELPDIAMIALRLPKLGGMDVLERVQQAGIATRILVLSRLTDAHLVQRALALGAAGYLGKESPTTVILDAIRTVANGSRYIDPTLIVGLIEPSGKRLTEREVQVLQLVANGQQNKAIALGLGVSEETVKSHISNVIRKLDAHSRTDAVASALRRSLIE